MYPKNISKILTILKIFTYAPKNSLYQSNDDVKKKLLYAGVINSAPLNAKNSTIEIRNALALPLEKFETNITSSANTISGKNDKIYAAVGLKMLVSIPSVKSDTIIAHIKEKIRNAIIKVAPAKAFAR